MKSSCLATRVSVILTILTTAMSVQSHTETNRTVETQTALKRLLKNESYAEAIELIQNRLHEFEPAMA